MPTGSESAGNSRDHDRGKHDKWQLKRLAGARLALFLATLGASMLAAELAAGADITGFARRINGGDAFSVCTGRNCQLVRLCGIRSTPRFTPGFRAARDALRSAALGKTVRCRPVGEGTPCDARVPVPVKGQRRVLAQCFLPGGADLAGVLVKSGHACDRQRVTGGHYMRTAGGKACPR